MRDSVWLAAAAPRATPSLARRCQDVLPARSRQVLVVFTHDGSKRAQCRFGWVGQQMPGTAEAHMPPLEPENRDLHAPMPMDKEVVGANDLAAALAAAIGGSAS